MWDVDVWEGCVEIGITELTLHSTASLRPSDSFW
jgi:hypothetical protein